MPEKIMYAVFVERHNPLWLPWDDEPKTQELLVGIATSRLEREEMFRFMEAWCTMPSGGYSPGDYFKVFAVSFPLNFAFANGFTSDELIRGGGLLIHPKPKKFGT